MSAVVLLELKAHPAMLADLQALLHEMLPTTRRFRGCETISMHQMDGDPLTMVIFERWQDPSFYKAYVRWRGERGDLDRLVSLVQGTPHIRTFDDWSP